MSRANHHGSNSNATNDIASAKLAFRGPAKLYGNFLDGPLPQPRWIISNRSTRKQDKKKISLAVLKFTEPA